MCVYIYVITQVGMRNEYVISKKFLIVAMFSNFSYILIVEFSAVLVL